MIMHVIFVLIGNDLQNQFMTYPWFEIRIKHLPVWGLCTLSDFFLFLLDPVFPPNDHLWVKRKHPKSHLWLWENSISVLPSPIDTFFSSKYMLLWSVGSLFSLLKHVLILVKKTPRLFLVSQIQELRRSKFLITNWGYVGAKAPLLLATPVQTNQDIVNGPMP